MAGKDLQINSKVKGTPKAGQITKQTIDLKVKDSQTGAILADFTGKSALVFPDDFLTLPDAIQDELVDYVIRRIIAYKVDNI